LKIIHTEASWGWGGQEIRILTESQALIARGHQVCVVADPRSQIFKNARKYNVSVYPVTMGKKRLKDLLSVRRAITRTEPDLIVCHSSTDHWLVAIARLTLNSRFKVVRARHISAPVKANLATRWLYTKGCEAVTTTSHSIAQHLIDTLDIQTSKVHNIPTGLDWEPPSNQEVLDTRLRVRPLFGLDSQSILVVIVATLRSWKGHDDLLLAWLDLQRLGIYSKAKLLIVGDGPQRNQLEQRVNELSLKSTVSLVGHRTDVRDLLLAADLFCLPSYANEGVPQAVLQAMAVGLPIISSRIPGIVEAVKGYDSKVLVPPRSIPELTKALTATFEEISQRGQQARHPLIKFSMTEMIDRCLEVYRIS
jgi:glycosyltransferase involved in cell wall biosynthesis